MVDCYLGFLNWLSSFVLGLFYSTVLGYFFVCLITLLVIELIFLTLRR